MTHERLLTKEQVNALENLDDLTAIQDAIMEAAKAIEVDLEFRTDENADDEWEHRARRALTAHYICNGHITRRINFLRRGGKAPKQHDDVAKARRIEAQAQLVAAQAEHKRLKSAEDREKSARAFAQIAARQSLLLHFHKVAAAHLDKPTMALLMKRAQTSMVEAMEEYLPSDSGSDVRSIAERRQRSWRIAQP